MTTMTLQTTTLRPGLLVSLKTSIKGNVSYKTTSIEPEHITDSGIKKSVWETERKIADPAEDERAKKVRSDARGIVTAVCAQSAFGLLCPEEKADKLDAAIKDARALVDRFNAGAKLSAIRFYVLAGRVSPDDVEAARAINSEMRDLIDTMTEGMKNFDVKKIRDAAERAKAVGGMLSDEAKGRAEKAITIARKTAREMVRAIDVGIEEVDRIAIRRLEEARTAFLDLDDDEPQQVAVTQAPASAPALDVETDNSESRPSFTSGLAASVKMRR